MLNTNSRSTLDLGSRLRQCSQCRSLSPSRSISPHTSPLMVRRPRHRSSHKRTSLATSRNPRSRTYSPKTPSSHLSNPNRLHKMLKLPRPSRSLPDHQPRPGHLSPLFRASRLLLPILYRVQSPTRPSPRPHQSSHLLPHPHHSLQSQSLLESNPSLKFHPRLPLRLPQLKRPHPSQRLGHPTRKSRRHLVHRSERSSRPSPRSLKPGSKLLLRLEQITPSHRLLSPLPKTCQLRCLGVFQLRTPRVLKSRHRRLLLPPRLQFGDRAKQPHRKRL